MKIFVDSKRQLNYHPLVVYFILQPKDYDLHAKNIEKLNEYVGFTRGIFKYRAIARGNEYSHVLMADLAATINRFNVVLRLVDDKDGNYNYALGRMNFNQSPDLFELSLQKFVISACKQNVKNLNGQLTGYIGNSEESVENVSVVTEMIQGFNAAINVKTFKRGVWRQIVSPNEFKSIRGEALFSKSIRGGLFNEVGDVLCRSDFNYAHPSELDEDKEYLYQVLPDKKAKDVFDKLMRHYARFENVPSVEESDMYVQGTVDDSKSKALRADYGSRNKQGDGSNITIYIKKISTEKFRKSSRKEWGVEINISGTVIPVYMGSTAATMVYVGALLKRKMGTYLYRDIFNKRLPRMPRASWPEDLLWLQKLYGVLFYGSNDKFEEWYIKMRENFCHYIDVGKSRSTTIVKKCLADYPASIYNCTIQSKKDNTGIDNGRRTYYYFDIPAENIIVSSELEF